MVDRLDYKIVGLAILVLLCWMGYSPLACRGAVVWSDDFNDGNYNGWTICENSVICSESNWSATNNYLQLEQEEWGVISHPSTVAYGKWNFDFKANETLVESGTFASISFISNNVHDLDNFDDWITYWIYFEATTGGAEKDFVIKLRKNVNTIIDTSETIVPVAGWHHIEVTRTTAGLFSVYLNDSLIMQGTDTEIDTSELFVFGIVERRGMFDNVVVDDAPPIEWGPIIIIGVSAIAIIAVVVIYLKRR